MRTTSTNLSTTSPPTCEPSSPTVPTLSESDIYGNDKGTNDVTRHEVDLFPRDLNNSCVVLHVDLVTPPIFENNISELNLPCDELVDIPAVLSAPITEINYSLDLDLGVPNELNIDTNVSVDLLVTPDLDHIKLVRHDKVLAKISHDASLWSIMMNPL